MKKIIFVLLINQLSINAIITDNPSYVPYSRIRDRLGVETQEFRNRTPYNLEIVVYFEGNQTITIQVNRGERSAIDTKFLCTQSFVVYPLNKIAGEDTPPPTSFAVHECNDRITSIHYDNSGYFYTSTSHKI